MTGFYKDYADSSDTHQNSAEASADAAEVSANEAAASAAAAQDLEVTSASFDTADGTLTLTKTNSGTVTTDLDGRYLTTHQDISGKADLAGATFTGAVSAPNIGIGTTSPANTLTVGNTENSIVDQDATVGIKCNANHKGIMLQENSGGEQWSIGVGEAGSLKFYDSAVATPAVTFEDVTGNVGIGTDSPSEALDVDGNIAVSGTVDGRDVLADGTKLDLIEANATADQTGAEIKSAYEAVADTNAFTDAEKTKLSNIEASADVTDTVNVTAAGALMDSEVTNLAQVKAFDSSDYLTTHQDISGKANLSGANFTGAVNIADDISLQFGNNDLRIYHDSTSNSSFIREQGTGSFVVQGNNLVLSDTNSSKYLFGISGGQTNLYYNGTEKLNTKSAGIGVTGDITLTGTVDGVDIATLNSNAIVDGDFTTAGIMTTDGSGGYSVDSSTYATETYVDTAVSNLVDSAPATLDTLNELASALGDDANFSTTVTTSIGTKWTEDATKIGYWDTAYSWGDHDAVGYLTTHQDISGKANLSGASFTGNVSLPDNGKLLLGASDDLQIYHDTGNSIIADKGVGDLYIQGSNTIRLTNADVTEHYAKFNHNGGVELRHDNSIKFNTTSSGIDVTGTATMDGLVVDGGLDVNMNTGVADFSFNDGGYLKIHNASRTSDYRISTIGSSAEELRFRNGASQDLLRLNKNGDISFYEDTGTTAKFFWDASAESLMLNASTRIGTEILTVNGTVTTGGGTASAPALAFRADSNTGIFRPASQSIGVSTNGSERMRIDSSGRVGIGTTSPSSILDLGSNTNTSQEITISGGRATFGYDVAKGASGAVVIQGSANKAIHFENTADTSAMVIDASGNVGIGTNSPTEALDVTGNIAVSGTVDGVDLATTIVDGDFTSNGFMKRTGAGTYTVDTSSYLSSYGGTVNGSVTVSGTPPSGQGVLTAHFLKGNTTTGGATTPVLDLEKNITGTNGSGRFIEFNTKSIVTGSIVTRGHLGLNQTSSNYTAFPYFSHGGGNCGLALALSGSDSFNAIVPASTTGGSTSSNINLGHQYARWNGVYLKISPNVSSDREYKRDIEELSEAEKRVAVACKGLIRKYRMKDAYEKKGEDARLHIGIIAQDLQDAFTAEGLDAHRYGMFCSDTWHQATVTTEDEDGNVTTSVEDFELVEHAPEGATDITEITRLSVRYEELLAFIISTT
jgi:hypothetical protein